MKQFAPGAPAKLHCPGKPWHKTLVRIRRRLDVDRWEVLVRRWPRKALRANPKVGGYWVVTAFEAQIQLLPGRSVYQ